MGFQPALCAKGYSETFNGVMGALLIARLVFPVLIRFRNETCN